MPNAILALCDPDLLAAMRLAEAHALSLFGKGGPELAIARTQVQIAQKAFLAEVIWRVEIEVILLTGVQTEPELQSVRSKIPSAWATTMTFDFEQRWVTCPGYKWIAVRASLAKFPDEDGGRGPAVHAERDLVDGGIDAGAEGHQEPAGVDVSIHDGVAPGKRGRGRESYDDRIIEGIRLVFAGREMPKAPPYGWSALADHVLKALARRHPALHAKNKLPAIATIRTRLPKFYDALLENPPVR